MTEASRIADRIQRQLPKLQSGTLRFWGQWFGRPWDNYHTVVGASAKDESLEIQFDDRETLWVMQPSGWMVDAEVFRIDDAARLRWEWNAYGNPPGRRYFEEYVRRGDEIVASTDVDWYVPDLQPSAAEPAVVIV